MKRLLTFAITTLLGASLALAQTTGDKAKTGKTALNPQPLPPGKVTPAATTKTNTSGKKGTGKKGGSNHHKGNGTQSNGKVPPKSS